MDWREDFLQDQASVDWTIVGLPGDLDIQQLLRDTEEKLKLNACSGLSEVIVSAAVSPVSIEQCLKELEVKLGDSGTGEKASTPADILQWFSPRNLTLMKPTCAGQQQLLDFLRALQQFLRTEEKEREEATLQLLLDISSQCGVAFPSPAPLTSLQGVPGSPIHGVREEAALEVQEIWEDIRLLLRRHLLDKLQNIADPEDGGSETHLSQRAQRLQQLLFFYPEAEVLSRYRTVRVKAVQEVFQQGGQSSSPAEKGFDSLARSFGTACPALLRLVGEDLRALSSVVEPAAVLAFVNHTHLATVTCELSVAMEKLVENTAKDNSATCGKGRKSSAKSRVAVAPQEDVPQRERSFCLTSHQLRQLTLLAGVLLDLEERVEELVSDLGFLCCAGETPGSVRGILKKVRDDPETTVRESSRLAPEIFPQVPEATALEFGWRPAFRKLALPMVQCIKALLEDACAKGLQQEEAEHASGPTSRLASTSLPPAEGLSAPDELPKTIAKFAGDIMEEVDALFPLALVCQEDSLVEVRSSFVEVAGKVTSAILGRLQERAVEVPALAPLQNLPVLLATGVFLQQRLTHYQNRLKDPGRRYLSLLPIPKCQELTEALQEQLTGYCIQVCATCILQDPESHHWADPKPFYEGERCSFSIHMWHYFLSGLRSDLWATLPPSLAQEVLAQVLSHTLEVLVQRYSRACPSDTRTQQIRTDITAILLCVEQLILGVCDSVEALLWPGPWDRLWISSVHSLCDQLLAVLAIVTSPLSALHQHFYRTPVDGPPPSQNEAPSYNQAALWLCHIKSSLFSEESLRSTAAVAAGDLSVVGRLRLLCAQPDCNYRLLLQALLQSDCILLQVLLQHSRLCVDDEAGNSAETGQDRDAFLEVLFSVFSSLNSAPKALALMLEGYFDKRHLWDHLYNLADSSQSEPAVLRCLRAMVTASIDGIISRIVAMVTSWQVSEDHVPMLHTQVVPESVLSKIPKEWNFTSQNPQQKESANDCTRLLVQALSFVFSNLPCVVATLPLPVRFLFHTGERRLSQGSRQLKPTGLLLWNVLGLLCQSLEEGGTAQRLAPWPLSRGDVERLSLVADCLRAAMGLQKGVPKPAAHKALQALEEMRPKWSFGQLQKARILCAEGAFEVAGSSGAAERASVGAPKPTEQKIGLMVLEICHKAGGAGYLRQIYHIIRLNEELLTARLSAPPGSAPHAPAMVLRPDPRHPQPRFHPIAEFNHIGGREFDQSAVSDWCWDWAQLLPAYQRMSQVTLKTLLANRWDLQDGAALEDEERALAALLRKACFSASPGS